MDYYVPTWISVNSIVNGLEVSDGLRGTRYVLRGRLEKLYRKFLARGAGSTHSTSVTSLLSTDEDDELNQAIASQLQEKGLLAEPDSAHEVPLLLPTQQPLLGSRAKPVTGHSGITFFGAPSNAGNRQTSGTVDAPDAVRTLAREYGLQSFQLGARTARNLCGIEGIGSTLGCELPEHVYTDIGNILGFVDSPAATIHGRVEAAAGEILARERVPFMIGGDHSMSAGMLAACGQTVDRFQVFHIDAHTDCYQNAIRAGLPDFQGIPDHGNVMSWSLAQVPAIQMIHQFGIRGVINLADPGDPRRHVVPLADTVAMAHSAEPYLDAAIDEPVYLSIDIDALDPSVVPGTAHPVPNGLMLNDLFKLLRNLLVGRRLIGIDIVELDVSRDRDRLSCLVVVELIAFLVALINAGHVALHTDRPVDDAHAFVCTVADTESPATCFVA